MEGCGCAEGSPHISVEELDLRIGMGASRLRSRRAPPLPPNAVWLQLEDRPVFLAPLFAAGGGGPSSAELCLMVERAEFALSDLAVEADGVATTATVSHLSSYAGRVGRYAADRVLRLQDLEPGNIGYVSAGLEKGWRTIDAGCLVVARGQLDVSSVWSVVRKRQGDYPFYSNRRLSRYS